MDNHSFSTVNSTAQCHLPFDMALAMFTINIVVGIIGTIGNLLVCLAVFTTPNLQRISNYFICSLAVADVTITSAAQPLLTVMLWGRMRGGCYPNVEEAFRVIGNVSCAVSLLTLCLISVDRCISIVKPFSYQSIITTTKFISMVATAWVFSGVYTFLRMQVSKKITSYISVALFSSGYAVFATCYILILYTVKKQAEQRSEMVADVKGKALQASQAMERRLTVTVLLIMLVFTVAWTPLFYLRIRAPKKNFGILYDWARTVALSSSAVNPVLYCIRNEEYRNSFLRLLRAVFCCGRFAKVAVTQSTSVQTPRTASTRATV